MRGVWSPARFDPGTFRSIGTNANQKGEKKKKKGRRLIIAGIYDVSDLETSALPQAVAFLETLEKNADFFRHLMLKYGKTNDASIIRARSFWLLLNKCKLVTPKFCFAELNRLFVLNRIRQLYPHPRDKTSR